MKPHSYHQGLFIILNLVLVFFIFSEIELSGQSFRIIGIPDIQNYTSFKNGGTPRQLYSQMQWIANNKNTLNIAFVTQYGDLTYYNEVAEWQYADTAFSILEKSNIPYGLTIGNHDGIFDTNKYHIDSTLFNQYFGKSRYMGKDFYGDAFRGNNTCNFQLFTAGGMDFIAIHLTYVASLAQINWADSLLKAYPKRRGMLTTHGLIDVGNPGQWLQVGQNIYNRLCDNPNLFMMLCGHMHGQGYRFDVLNGSTIHTILSDFQGDEYDGGSGYLKIFEFVPEKDSIFVKSFSPVENKFILDPEHNFSIYYDMDAPKHHAQFYIAPGGDDSSDGSFEKPWATLSYAAKQVSPGDTVLLRGGVYDMRSNVIISGLSGTADKHIFFLNYPGEKPIFDFTNWIPSSSLSDQEGAISLENNCHYIEFKGITVRNVNQVYDRNVVIGFKGYNSTNITFRNCTAHHIQGKGWRLYNCSADVINCDAYRCFDPLRSDSFPGNGGTGFNVGSDETTILRYYFFGCRSWENSDQGFSGIGRGTAIFDNCWTWNNAPKDMNLTGPGLGSGFKFGLNYTQTSEGPTLIVRNCIAAYCPHGGINDNAGSSVPINEYFYNNTIYRCNSGFSIIPTLYTEENGYSKREVILRNNVSYQNVSNFFEGKNIHDHNSWDLALNVKDTDFLSIDTTGISGPRNEDGSQPNIDFLKLAKSSGLIDAGVYVGTEFHGTNPDLGWSESPSMTNPVTEPVKPQFVNATVANQTPDKLEINFNLPLASIQPPLSAFIVYVNGSLRTINYVSVFGSKVVLTLRTAVVFGDNITINYNKPSINPLQSTSGEQVESILAKTVINNVTTIIPVFVSAVIQNSSPSLLEMKYNIPLASIVPSSSAYEVRVNSAICPVNSVAIKDVHVLLTLSSPVQAGDAITISYKMPTVNPIQSLSGGKAADINPQSVINNCTSVTNEPPIVSISSPTKSNSLVSPATITINAIASDKDGYITKVLFYEGSHVLGESVLAPYSYTWKEVGEGAYSITAIAVDDKNARTVSAPMNIVVKKSSSIINQSPVVRITSPSNNNNKFKKHDKIVFEIEAYDPDGSISKIELKSGSTTIAELTSEPYNFNWENPDTGTFVIKAIATDNLGASSSSEQIEVKIIPIKNINTAKLIEIYPNPNQGLFWIQPSQSETYQKKQLAIINMNGHVVYRTLADGDGSPIEIKLTDPNSGIYVALLIVDDKIISSEKFIIR